MLQVSVGYWNKISIIKLQGDFTIESISRVSRFWIKEIATRPRIIVIDCKDLSRIDSTAIATLVSFFNTAMERRIRIFFCDVNEPIQALFAVAHLDRHFHVTTMERFRRKHVDRKTAVFTPSSSFVTA